MLFQKGVLPVGLLVLFGAVLVISVPLVTSAAKKNKKQISAAVACAANPESKQCKKALPKDLDVEGVPKCSDSAYSVKLDWERKGEGWSVDISANSDFGTFGSYDVSNKEFLKLGPENLSLGPGVTYHWRIFYGLSGHWVNGPGFSVPYCSAQPSASPSPCLPIVIQDEQGNQIIGDPECAFRSPPPYSTPIYGTPEYFTPSGTDSTLPKYSTPTYSSPSYGSPSYGTPYPTPTYYSPGGVTVN